MVRGQYTAATGMMLQRRMMEVITNNIVNAETTGYKKDIVVSRTFDDVLIERINDGRSSGQAVGPLNFGTRVDLVHTDFTQGNLETTDNITDIAMVGDAYFVVETAQGERYTRNSAWSVNSEGYLVDGDGNYLLSNRGRTYVGTQGQFGIDYSGNVTVQGNYAGTLRAVGFEDTTQLRKIGNNLIDALGQPIETTEYEIRQGFIESSNVEIAREMVDMMTVYRVYETNQRMLTMIDEIVGKAVNDIGRLR